MIHTQPKISNLSFSLETCSNKQAKNLIYSTLPRLVFISFNWEGACVRIEKEAPGGLPLVWLACRRHKLERDYNAAFRATFPGPTKAPADDLCEQINTLVEENRLPDHLDESNRHLFRDKSPFFDKQRGRIASLLEKMGPTAERTNALPRDAYRFLLNLIAVNKSFFRTLLLSSMGYSPTPTF